MVVAVEQARFEADIRDVIVSTRDLAPAIKAAVVAEGLKDAAGEARRLARAEVPVRKGSLKRSIARRALTGQINTPEGIIRLKQALFAVRAGNLKPRRDPRTAFYSHFVHRGTVKQAANPFLSAAVDRNFTALTAAFKRGVNRGNAFLRWRVSGKKRPGRAITQILNERRA